MPEQLVAPRTFENQLSDLRHLETANGLVEFVELIPEKPESEVPIMLIAGFGTDIESTALAAKRLYEQNRSVIMLNRAPITDRGYETRDGIDGLQHQIAEDILNVADAAGLEEVDAIVQSMGAIFTTAAALKRPELFRSLVIEAGAGTIGDITPQELAGRVAMDSVLGARGYLRNPFQTVTSLKRVLGHLSENGGDATWREIESIAHSDITDGALQRVRAAGTKVAYIHANADTAFKPAEVHQHIAMNMQRSTADDNVDAYASVADRHAHHNSLLFDKKGVYSALALIRQFEAEEQHAPLDHDQLTLAA